MATVFELEEALATVLRRNGFEIVHHDGERFLRPVLSGVISELVSEIPLLNLNAAARDLERWLS